MISHREAMMTGAVMKKVTEEFRQEAVRIALSSGRIIGQVGRTFGLANED